MGEREKGVVGEGPTREISRSNSARCCSKYEVALGDAMVDRCEFALVSLEIVSR